jgi:hypothetical protein
VIGTLNKLKMEGIFLNIIKPIHEIPVVIPCSIV